MVSLFFLKHQDTKMEFDICPLLQGQVRDRFGMNNPEVCSNPIFAIIILDLSFPNC